MDQNEIKHIDLSKIKDPKFLKDLTYPELKVLSDDIRDYIIDSVSKNGGHLSSNLGVVDATIALCRSFDFLNDKIIFDVGHQCYTYKVLTGRSLDNLRKTNGVSGFQKMDESPYDHFECGHSSTSISAALGMATARDLNKENYHIVSFIGDASIVNGLSFEAINNSSNGHHKIIIVLNNNNMAISKARGGVAHFFRTCSNTHFYEKSKNVLKRMFGNTKGGKKFLNGLGAIKHWFKRRLLNLNTLDFFGFKFIGPVDGHNIKKLEKAFAKAKEMNKSVVVYINTEKGKGYKYAEQDVSGAWHGVNAFDKESGISLNQKECTSWSKAYETILEEEMEHNDKIITIVPGTSVGSALDNIFSKFPNRIVDVGIAEEHAFTYASGLAVSGFHPVISIYSTFMQRGYDQISHDLARLKCNATILVDRSGLVGSDGDTHQGIYDEQFLLGIPNTVVSMPSRYEEAKTIFKESLKGHGVFAIRYPRECIDTGVGEGETSFGKWKKELDGEKVAIVSVGPLTICLKAKLIEQNKKITLYNAIYQKPMDENVIHELLSYDKIIIYNAYSIEEGFASMLAARLMALSYKGKVVIKAIKDEFVGQSTIFEQREKYHLNPEDIIKEI